jgi:SAM-dependent methyltransferase
VLVLRPHTRLRTLAKRGSRAARDRILGPTWATSRYWERRHERAPGMFDAYWETRDQPLRLLLAERARPASSVLEVGCGVGVNLVHVDAEQIAGADVSAAAIEYARQKLPHCELVAAPGHELPFDDGSFELVFTAGLLVCVGPDLAARMLGELLRVSSGRVMLAEGGPPEGSEVWNDETVYWRRDYVALFRELGVDAESEPLPEEAVIGHIDTLVTARRAPG